MQMPVFILLFFAPVYVPLDLLSGAMHARRDAQPDHVRARGRAQPDLGRARRRWRSRSSSPLRSPARSSCGPSAVSVAPKPPAENRRAPPVRCAGESRRLARSAVSARSHLGRRGDELQPLLGERRAGRALPLRRRTTSRSAWRSSTRPPTPGTATSRASGRGSGTATASTAPGARADGTAVQPVEAPDRPLREVDRRADPLRARARRSRTRPARRTCATTPTRRPRSRAAS